MATAFYVNLKSSGGDYASAASAFSDGNLMCNLSSSSSGSMSRVFTGTPTGSLTGGDSVTLYRPGTGDLGVNGTVAKLSVATGQLLVKNISWGTYSPAVDDYWRKTDSDYFTLTNTGDSAILVVRAEEDFVDTGGEVYINHANLTTGASNYVLFAASAAYGTLHENTPNTGYRLQIPSYKYGIYIANKNYVRVLGIAFTLANASYSYGMVSTENYTTSSAIRIYKCFIPSGGAGSQPIMKCTGSHIGNLYIYNNTIVSRSGGPTGISITHTTAGTISISNNDLIDCPVGIAQSGTNTTTVTNDLFSNCTTDATGTITDTCCSTTNDNTKGLNASEGTNRFEQTIGWDGGSAPPYDLASDDTAARTYGTASPDGAIFTDDIHGVARGATWDIGSDQVTGGTTSRNVVVGDNIMAA